MSHATTENDFIRSSGNVFADLGLPNADEELAKAKLALSIRQQIEALNLTQTAAAKRLGTDQAKVSRLVRGKVASFSLDRLIRFINALEMDVQITVEPTRDHQPGTTLVKTAQAD
jgi:predicted XRE-type DNA-binding protein